MAKGKEFSVTEIAELLGVGRTTVGYWIRSKKIRANRTGRNYRIPVEELIHFLRVSEMDIPSELAESEPLFRTHIPCWQYWEETEHGKKCEACVIHEKHIDACFTARNEDCHRCRYYQNYVFPKIQMIHQMSIPAAIVKELCIWNANSMFAELCGLPSKDLIGIGIEEIIHSESLGLLVADFKKRDLGNISVEQKYNIFLKNNKLKAEISIYSLREPDKAYLIVSE